MCALEQGENILIQNDEDNLKGIWRRWPTILRTGELGPTNYVVLMSSRTTGPGLGFQGEWDGEVSQARTEEQRERERERERGGERIVQNNLQTFLLKSTSNLKGSQRIISDFSPLEDVTLCSEPWADRDVCDDPWTEQQRGQSEL